MFRRLFSRFLNRDAPSPVNPEAGGDDFELPPQFPRVRGVYQLTKEWQVTLPGEFALRFEQGEFGTDLVLWRKGITCWTTVYTMKAGETPASTLEWIRRDAPEAAAVETFLTPDSSPIRYAYLLHETEEDAPERWALYSFAFGQSGHIMMSIYFDDKDDIELAKEIWASLTEEATS
ncbi:hypothetical protein [Verrucomicrobium sp. BvORR034]|uniref:hypothetical protein n=1 Tax=Verrucomicrobium sp. BvORR034 TaxID=1396418 RepID=UPI002240F50A|nr:hypothetical protein [Verrucomicrobium sp. BvORR034]